MTQNEHDCARCGRLEVDCDVISGRNVKTFVGYVVVNFEGVSSSSFQDIPKTIRDGGGGHDDSIKRKRIRASLKYPINDGAVRNVTPFNVTRQHWSQIGPIFSVKDQNI